MNGPPGNGKGGLPAAYPEKTKVNVGPLVTDKNPFRKYARIVQVDLWVLTFTVDDSDPNWETRQTVVGTREQLAKLFDLKRLPYGARLLKGKAATRYLKRGFKEEK